MYAKFMKVASLALSVMLAVTSCHRTEEIIPSFDFAPYVSAYSGGVLSSSSHIRVELSQEVDVVDVGMPVSERLFSFSPNIKGAAYWLNNSVIEFIPDSGELKPGTMYKAKLFLSKIMTVEKAQKTFEFTFFVQQKDYMLSINPIEVPAATPEIVNVSGQLSFSDEVSLEDLQQALSVSGMASAPPITVAGTDDPRVFIFQVHGIAKTDKEQTLKITFDGRRLGIDDKSVTKVEIPALGEFKYLSAQLITVPENGISVVFSEPISTLQDVRGLIGIAQVEDAVVQIHDNVIDLFFATPSTQYSNDDEDTERNVDEDIDPAKNPEYVQLYIDESLNSVQNTRLGKSHKLQIKTLVTAPEVKLLSDGMILPDACHQNLDFKAVSLQAVDMEIIKIYESNVLSYLQRNALGSNNGYGLRMAGRMVYKKTFYLNPKASECNQWKNYSVDLKNLIKQEPGAFYRIRLSFKQEYATAPFNKKTLAHNNSEMVSIVSGDMVNEDGKWDYTNDFAGDYYGDDYYYDEQYEWSQRNNPYHPSYYMGSSRTVTTTLVASNLGLIVKGNNSNGYWAVVTDILTTKPISGVVVDLYNYQLQKVGSGRTNADGFVEIKTTHKAFAAVASREQEKTYLRLVDNAGNDMSRFDVGGDIVAKGGLKGFIYGERGVWRPGDTLHLTLILDDKQQTLPSNHPVSLEIFNATGQFAYKKILSKSVNRFYTFAVPTKATDPTGAWNAYFTVGQNTFHKQLRVETIKPNRLKISTNVKDGATLSAAIPMQIKLQASWLTGAKADQLKVDVERTISTTATSFKNYADYIFDNPAVNFERTTEPIYHGKLNSDGQLSFRIAALNNNNTPGLLKAQFVYRVYEPGGDASIHTQSCILSPFSTYVGLRTNADAYGNIEAGPEHTFDVVTVNTDGKPVACSTLEYKIYKISWDWWWHNSDRDFSDFVNSSSIQPIASGTLTTNGRSGAKMPFRIDNSDYGRYLVYVKDLSGGHASGTVVYAWSRSSGTNAEDPTGVKMLTFTTDKREYAIGETIGIDIPNVGGGVALMSVENGSEVLSQQWVKLDKTGVTHCQIVADKRMTPNAYIHITLLQAHAKAGMDQPIRKYGVQPVFVMNTETKLVPQIVCNNTVRPEQAFSVKVSEQQGKAMTYTLAVVDEGLLGLTNFKTPNPWNHFYAREALGIRTWDIFDYVIGAFAGKYAKMFSIGGDEDMNGQVGGNKNRFKPVVRFMGPFELKKGSTNTHQVKLPLYVGAVRVMVVAGQNGAYGSAEKEVAVRAPLMSLSTLPRQIGINETIDLPVNVFAMEPNVKDATVKVSTTGILKLKGGNTQTVSFNQVGDKVLYFKLQSTSATGVEKVSITAMGAGKTFNEHIEINVNNPNPLAVFSQRQLVAGGETVTLPYYLAVKGGNDNYLSLELGSMPSVNIMGHYSYLSDYYHACSEQMASKALPMLFYDKFKKLTVDEKTAIDKQINSIIHDLYGRQFSNGGFVYWAGDEYTNDWITSYVGHCLILAKEKGYEVNKNVINKWLQFQRTNARNWRATDRNRSRYAYYQSDLEQAYRLYTLALTGSPDVGAMNRLKEFSAISQQARWRLAAAYALIGKQKIASSLIADADKMVDSYSANNTSFGSSLRDEAMILETLLLLGRDAEAFELSGRMAEKYNFDAGYTTQSSAYLLLAMAKLSEKMSKTITASWSLDNAKTQSLNTAQQLSVCKLFPTKHNGTLTVTNKSDRNLYVNLITHTRPLRDTLSATSRNLKLTVRYTDMQGNALNVHHLSQGKDFYAVITVSNTNVLSDCNDLALSFRVPSGWEIYNERFVTGGDEADQNYNYQDVRDDRVLTYFDLQRGRSVVFKVRLQAAYGGEYILPATVCEAMYDNNVYARTQADYVQVSR